MVKKSKVLSKQKAKAQGSSKDAKQEKFRRQNRAAKDKEKQPYLDDVGHNLAQLGLRIKTVAADGNCFFRACCDQHLGSEIDHLGFRQKVVAFMQSHPDDFSPYMEDGEDFTAYCKRMEKEGTWAGLHEQVAAARLCHVKIRIYQAGQPCWTIQPSFEDVPEDAPSWHLSYHNGEHYNSVRLVTDYSQGPPEEIPIVDSKVAASAPEVSGRQEAQKVQTVKEGTGCMDEGLIRIALAECKGRVDQAIESTIERMAADVELENDASTDALLADDVAESKHLGLGLRSQNCPPNGPLDVPCSSSRKAVESDGSATDAVSIAVMGTRERVGSKEGSAETPDDPKSKGGEALANSEGPPRNKQDTKARGTERPPPRNWPCVCGSGRKYKNCCGTVKAAAARRQKASEDGRLTFSAEQPGSLYV